MQRRRRDLNPRAAFNDLHPFQGCPFGQLGYFSRNTCCPTIWRLCLRHILLWMIESHLRSNGEDGIRTHAPLRTNGFQDRLVIATSIPLQNRFVLLFCSARLIYHPADRMSTLFLWAYFMKRYCSQLFSALTRKNTLNKTLLASFSVFHEHSTFRQASSSLL